MSPQHDDDCPVGNMEKAIGDAISAALSTGNGSFVTKWVSVVEVMDPDGERGVWTFTSSDAKRWDIMGLLQEVEHFQSAQTIAEILREDR